VAPLLNEILEPILKSEFDNMGMKHPDAFRLCIPANVYEEMCGQYGRADVERYFFKYEAVNP